MSLSACSEKRVEGGTKHPDSSGTATTAAVSLRVGALPLHVTGEVKDYVRERLQQKLTEGLQRGTFETVALAPEAPCADATCAAALAAEHDIAYLVRVEMTNNQGVHEIVVTLVDPATGGAVATSRETCELCGAADLETFVADAVGKQVPRIDSLLRTNAYVAISGYPGNAEVELDGRALGDAPLETPVDAGDHVVVVSREKFLPFEYRWTATRGVRELVDFRLQTAADAPRRPTLRPLWGWLTAGAGIALLGSGIAMIAIDEKTHQASCTPQSIDANGICPTRYATLELGVALTVTGGLALGTGTGLLIYSYRSRGRSRATATLNAGPGGLQLRGRF